MSVLAVEDVTGLLNLWRAGDRRAESELMSNLYPMLRAMAQRQRDGRSSVDATELVHEAYLRLLDRRAPWQSRTHFLAVVGLTLRRVAVDLVRRRQAEKRGALVEFVTLDWRNEDDQPATADPVDLLALDQALEGLAEHDAIAARLIELRYFAGLKNHEVAEVLGVGVATIVRHLRFGQAWMNAKL